MTNRFYSAIIDYADLRGCWNRQTGKLEVLVSVLACGFKSHFPHQCKGHSIFECPLFLYPTNQQSIISKKATLESHEIFDFVEAELVPQSDKASLRCLCQYWRVGSSPISRTIKETSFVYQDKRGFFLLSGQNTRRIIEKWALERSIGCSEARFFAFSGRNSPKTPVYT